MKHQGFILQDEHGKKYCRHQSRSISNHCRKHHLQQKKSADLQVVDQEQAGPSLISTYSEIRHWGSSLRRSARSYPVHRSLHRGGNCLQSFAQQVFEVLACWRGNSQGLSHIMKETFTNRVNEESVASTPSVSAKTGQASGSIHMLIGPGSAVKAVGAKRQLEVD